MQLVPHAPPPRALVLPCVSVHYLLHNGAVHPLYSHRGHCDLQLLCGRWANYPGSPERSLPVPVGDVPERNRERHRCVPPVGPRILRYTALFLRRHLWRVGEHHLLSA